MYLRCEDQGMYHEISLDKVKNIEPYNDGIYKQMKITLHDGTHGFADKIWFSEMSIFDPNKKG